jgi:SAM-dependent methyltransferase
MDVRLLRFEWQPVEWKGRHGAPDQVDGGVKPHLLLGVGGCPPRARAGAVKLFYEVGYRRFTLPWEGGPRSELVGLVESERLQPCRAVDLGCGSGSNATYLAAHGFEVTGIDFAASALAKAARLANEKNVHVDWI